VKYSIKLQSLVMLVVSPVLLLLALGWGLVVYRSVDTAITEGFERKLLATSGSAAVFVDPAELAAYQRRRTVTRLCDGEEGRLFAVDADTGEILTLVTSTGGARVLSPAPAGGVRSLAYDPASGRLFVLAADGRGLSIFQVKMGASDKLPEAAGSFSFTRALEGVYWDAGRLASWSGTQLQLIDESSGELVPRTERLPEEVLSIARATKRSELLALSKDGRTLLTQESPLLPLRRIVLVKQDDPKQPSEDLSVQERPRGLARCEAGVFAAGRGLMRLDVKAAKLAGAEFTTGYLDPEHPFYLRHRAPFMRIRAVTGLTYLYTSVYLGDDRIYYVLDGTLGDNYSLPGYDDTLPHPENIEGIRQVQLLGRPWISPVQKWDQWGLVKTSSYPISDYNGRTVGIAGADVEISIIREKTRWALFAVLLVGVASLLVASLVSLAIARSITRPLAKLRDRALHLAAGQPLAEAHGRRHRETAVLSGTLDKLARRLGEEGKEAVSGEDALWKRRRELLLTRALMDLDPGQGMPGQDMSPATPVPVRDDHKHSGPKMSLHPSTVQDSEPGSLAEKTFVLASVYPFSLLKAEELVIVASAFVPCLHAAGSRVVQAGEALGCLHVRVAGSLVDAEGREAAPVLGCGSLLAGRAPAVSLVAGASGYSALLLPRGRFHTVINECPVLLSGLLRLAPTETALEAGEETQT